MAEKMSKLNHECKEKINELEELKTKQKSERDEIDVKITDKKASISELMDKLFDGFEERPTKCMVHLNHPEDGKKTIYNLETGKTLEDCENWIEDMNDADFHLFPSESEIPDPHKEGWYIENYGFDPNAVEPKIEEYFLVDSQATLKDHGFNKKLFKQYRDCLFFRGTGGQYSNALDKAPEEIDFKGSLDIEENNDEKWFIFGPLNMKTDEESE